MAYQPVEPTPAQPAQPVYARPAAVSPPSPGAGMAGLAVRVVLTVLGAGGMIVGSFLSWFRSFDGTEIGIRGFVGQPGHTDVFLRSAGAVTILLGLIAIVGLAPRSGWLTRLAGALGIVALVMFLIQVYRAPGDFTVADLAVGAWVVVAGAVVALIGGFFGTRYRTVYTAPSATVEPAA